MITLADRVRETTTTTGTGTVDLDGAEAGYVGLVAGAGDGAEVPYLILGRAGGAADGEWETGLGTVTDAATDTLSRTTILGSSNGGAAVDFSAGTKDVFLTRPAATMRRSVDFAQYNTNQTVNSDSWAELGGGNLRVDVAASIGDVIQAGLGFQCSNEAGNLWADIGIYVSGALVRRFSQHGIAAPRGVTSWHARGGNHYSVGGVAPPLVVASGDLDSGRVYMRPLVATESGTSRSINNGIDATMWAMNIGQAFIVG